MLGSESKQRTAMMENGLLGLAVIITAHLALSPLLFLVYQTFFTPEYAGKTAIFTLGNYSTVFTAPETWSTLAHSAQFAIGSSLMAVAIGALLAWITERTNTPGRTWIYALNMIPLILPSILNTMCWAFILSPKVGFIRSFQVYSMGGMIWIQGLHWAPYAFVMLAGALRSMSADLEEAANVSGASTWKTFWRVSIPLNRPALVSISLILLVRGLESFEVPAVVGIPAGVDVLTSRIYLAVSKQYPRDYGLGSTYSLLLIAITGVGLYFYYRLIRGGHRFVTITGKGYRTNLLDLGVWRYATAAVYALYVLVAVGLPFLMMAWVSLTPFTMPLNLENLNRLTLQNYRQVFDYPGVVESFVNSVVLASVTAVAVVLLGLIVGWLYVKVKVRGGWILDTLGTLPLTLPGTVVGIAIATLYLKIPIGIYGTVWILMIAFVTRFLPYGVRAANSALLQIHPDMEEGALVAGASPLQTFRRVTLPIVWQSVAGTFIYIMVLTFREFSTAVLLYGPRSKPVAVQLYDMWQAAAFNQVTALGILLVLFLSPFSLLLRRFRHNEV